MIPALLNAALPARLIALSTPAAVRGWAVGQLLNATVVKVDSAAGTATLQIGERRVQAQVAGPMIPGQRLELRVLETGARTVMERLPGPQEDAARVQQQALRERLPQSVPMRDLLPALERTARDADATAATNTRTATVARTILDTLPAFKDLAQPETLRRAILTSGLFLESNLARAPDTDLRQLLPGDLKASLLRLAQAVTPGTASPPAAPPAAAPTAAAASGHPEPRMRATSGHAEPRPVAPPPLEDGAPPHPRIAEQARGGIAAIEVNQLKAAVETNQGSAVWTMELPVRDPSGDPRYLRLEVEEETVRRQGGMQRQWSMTVSMDLEPLGPMHARVTLIEDSVHTVIWSERPLTAELARLHAEWLRTQMRQAGLNPAEVQCLQGEPAPRAAAAPAPLVDTHA